MRKKVHTLTLFAMAALLVGVGIPTATRGASPIPDSDTTRPELQNFDVFLDGHADIARQLRNNPSLVNDEEFLENHPLLQRYLNNHANIREELRENPRAFVRENERPEDREMGRSGARDRGMTGADLSSFDAFLDNHPAISQQVSKDPSLVANQQYLQDHPELQQYLQKHPNVRDELTENPRAFMNAERGLERRDKTRRAEDI